MWSKLESYPPLFIRLMARKKYGRPLTTEEISQRSGLNPVEVEAISDMTSWDYLTIRQARQFMKGCQINIESTTDIKRVRDYLRHDPTFAYLRRSPLWDTYYKPKFIAWMKHYEDRRRAKSSR